MLFVGRRIARDRRAELLHFHELIASINMEGRSGAGVVVLRGAAGRPGPQFARGHPDRRAGVSAVAPGREFIRLDGCGDDRGQLRAVQLHHETVAKKGWRGCGHGGEIVPASPTSKHRPPRFRPIVRCALSVLDCPVAMTLRPAATTMLLETIRLPDLHSLVRTS